MSEWCTTSFKGSGFAFCIMRDKERHFKTGGLIDVKRHGEIKAHLNKIRDK